VDGIEIDVQMTADGRVVAHHDYWLDPDATRHDGAWLSGRGPALKSLTLAGLQAHDVGRLRPGSAEALRHADRQDVDGARIPTLAALLQALNGAKGPRRWLYVEIKTDPVRPEASPDPAVVTEAVLAELAAAGYLAHAKIIAFHWRVLRLATALSPGIATAHVTIPAALAGASAPVTDRASPWFDGADPWRHGGSELQAIRAHGGMEWSPYFTEVTPARVAEAKGLGLKVGPWGLSRAEDIRRMVELGVFSATVSGPAWA
jgi:glycerophosphoryl diester phosphodiesterase